MTVLSGYRLEKTLNMMESQRGAEQDVSMCKFLNHVHVCVLKSNCAPLPAGGTRRKATSARTSTPLGSLQRSCRMNSRAMESQRGAKKDVSVCVCVCVCVCVFVGIEKCV